MKTDKQSQKNRRDLILKLIREMSLSTQAALSAELEGRGIKVTQATLSRDMNDLGIVKFRRDDEIYYGIYESGQGPENYSGVYRSLIKSVSGVMFMLVCHTELGEAAILADEFDRENRAEVLGTVAGADTLLIVCDGVESASALLSEIQDALA